MDIYYDQRRYNNKIKKFEIILLLIFIMLLWLNIMLLVFLMLFPSQLKDVIEKYSDEIKKYFDNYILNVKIII